MNRRPYVIGLTGNIATGKSTVGKLLSQLGAEHIDADRLAHQLMAHGTPAWNEIVSEFGTQILRTDGTIDRGRLGSIVFSDTRALARLEAIVHPGVIERVQQLVAASAARVVVVEAIKLIESGMVSLLCDALWVVIASRDVQIRRLMEQRHLSYADAVMRIDAQPAQEIKAAYADVVIDNGGSIPATTRQVEQAWAGIGSADHAQAKRIQ